MGLKDEKINFIELGQILLGKSLFASIANVRGLRFEVRPKEMGHNEPHCHVSYQGRAISISLADFSVLEGNLPPKQQKQASEWVKDNIGVLRGYWNEYHEVVI